MDKKRILMTSSSSAPNIIDNKGKTMFEELKKALQNHEIASIDIAVGFFYFSGWKLIAEHLKDVKVRILVGYYLDPDDMPLLLSRVRHEGDNIELEPFRSRKAVTSSMEKKELYFKGLIKISNESSIYDDGSEQKALKIFEQKILDGSLEVKMPKQVEHGKLYILHNKNKEKTPGVIFMGSSNFTYRGLLTQGELNESYTDTDRFEEYTSFFEKLWLDSETIDIVSKETGEEFVDKLKENLWMYATPAPYEVYIRVLHELFAIKDDVKNIASPSKITNGAYMDLEYQIEAIQLVIEKLNKFDGVILADVVGLGKSIIASAAAHNMKLRTIIITPPHLKDQWNDYQSQFKIQGTQIFSSGDIKNLYKKYNKSNEAFLIIIDEAHRFRNEDTNDYKLLSKVCRSHPDNKVMLLTATPFNNDPKDVFALIRLFQTPGKSTIKSVDNLSLRFRELIKRYKNLNKERRKQLPDQKKINDEADLISKELRRLIEMVVIRRSRIDLTHITRYKEDLDKQGVQFSQVVGPEIMEYDLGELSDLYTETMQIIAGEDSGFIGARYKPATYIIDKKKFIEKYGEDLDESDLQTAQTNLAKFMKRLLVMRFESSKEAFKLTLANIINSNKNILRWHDELRMVPIMKKGQIPSPENIMESTDDDVNNELDQELFEEKLKGLKQDKGLITIKKDELTPDFLRDLKNDISLLESIYSRWFGDDSKVRQDIDPKVDELIKNIEKKINENKERKIVIFSSYLDTVEYLFKELEKRGFTRILKYSSKESSTKKREEIRRNFDASIPKDQQLNDYDVIISTDALSEGFNLHRAGIIINYDIPYNPTRVIQRVGRINRIDKKVFDNIYIYNFFPSAAGEREIRIKQITTLKMRLINSVIGSDTKTLTSDEEIKSFFLDEYQRAEQSQNIESWDTKYKEAYDQARKDNKLMDRILDIKPRSRVIRLNKNENVAVAFGKKGEHAMFALKKQEEEPLIVSSEDALKYFVAISEEKGQESDEQYDNTFELVRDALFARHELPEVTGRRKDAIINIEAIKESLPIAKDYCKDLIQVITKYDDISDGILKDIAQLSLIDMDKAFKELKELIPEHNISVINQRVNRFEEEQEIILLSEEHRI